MNRRESQPSRTTSQRDVEPEASTRESRRTPRLSRALQLCRRLENSLGKSVSVKELTEKFDVSRRTLFRDLGLLRDSGIRIDSQKPGGGVALHSPLGGLPDQLRLPEVVALVVYLDKRLEPRPGSAYGFALEAAARKAKSELMGSFGSLSEQAEEIYGDFCGQAAQKQ